VRDPRDVPERLEGRETGQRDPRSFVEAHTVGENGNLVLGGHDVFGQRAASERPLVQGAKDAISGALARRVTRADFTSEIDPARLGKTLSAEKPESPFPEQGILRVQRGADHAYQDLPGSGRRRRRHLTQLEPVDFAVGVVLNRPHGRDRSSSPTKKWATSGRDNAPYSVRDEQVPDAWPRRPREPLNAYAMIL
jgi:hypothetical protein